MKVFSLQRIQMVAKGILDPYGSHAWSCVPEIFCVGSSVFHITGFSVHHEGRAKPECCAFWLSAHQVLRKANVILWFSIWWNCWLEAAAHAPGDCPWVFWHWCWTSWLAELFHQTHNSWIIKNGFWVDDRFGSCSCEMMTFKIVSEKKDNNRTNWTSGEQTSTCSGNW